MANALYALGINGYLGGARDWLTDSNQIAFVTSSYSPNTGPTGDQFLGVAVPGGNIVAQSGNLGSPSIAGGVANAANETVSAVTGSTFVYVLGYAFITNNASSPLIFKIDTVTSGLPCTPNGGNIVMQWDTGSNKIFALKKAMDFSEWSGVRMIAKLFVRRFGIDVISETADAFHMGVPCLQQYFPTDEQATKHALWLESQAKAREIAAKFGGRIPVLA